MLARFPKLTLLAYVCFSLIGCGREDEIVIPAEVAQEAPPYCLEGSPYETPELFDAIAMSGVEFSFDYTKHEYYLNVKHLKDLIAAEITIAERFFTPPVLTDLKDGSLLSAAQVARLENTAVNFGDLEVSIQYDLNGVSQLIALDIDNDNVGNTIEILSYEVPLDTGINEVEVTFNIAMQAAYSGIECSLDEPTRDLVALYDAGQETEETLAAIAKLDSIRNGFDQAASYRFIISRDASSDMDLLTLDIPYEYYDTELIQDNNIALSENYLVLGMPLEDSQSAGAYTALEVQNNEQSAVVNDLAPDSGAVFIYERNAKGEWEFSWMLKANNVDAGDRFGASLSISGDLLVIAAPGEDSAASGVYSNFDSEGSYDQVAAQTTQAASIENLAPNSGAAYLYRRLANGSWAFDSYIKPNNNQRGANGFDKGFGQQVIITTRSGSGDQYFGHSLAIAAPNEDNSQATNSGAVYIYALNIVTNANLQYTEALSAPFPNEGDQFGASVALAEDGYIFVGAPYEQSADRDIFSGIFDDYAPLFSRENSGAVFAFRPLSLGAASAHEIDAVLKASNADEGDLFGSNLAVSGRFLAVSAPKEDSNGTGLNRSMDNNETEDSGAVYVFNRSSELGGHYQDLYIKPPSNELFSSFGNAVAMDDNDLVISHSKFANDEGSGILYVYSIDHVSSDWTLALSSVQEASTEFASSIAIDANAISATSKTSGKPLVLLH